MGKEPSPMRPLRAILTGLIVFALLACQAIPGPYGSATSTRLERILESRELRVGLSGNQPPLNMRNKQGEIIGLEVDLVTALAQSMGLEARLVTRPFSELLSSLEKNEVDLVISGMTITPERNARVAFAGPYFISGKSVLAKSEKMTNVDSSTELDDPNRTYVALAGSTSEDFVKDLMPQAKLVTTPDYDTAVKMVLEDEADALVADFPICTVSVLRHPEAGLSTLVTPFTVEPLGIALPADDPLFVNLVENYLNTLEQTGLLTRFKARWFSNGSWVSELP
jgi:polar amino acid transport system substrate-binding protein